MASLSDFLLNDFAHLKLIEVRVEALHNLAIGRHTLDLQPPGKNRGQFLDLAESFALFLEISSLASFMKLFEQHIHLHGASSAHLVDIPDLACQIGQRLVPLPIHLIIDSFLSFLFSLVYLILNLFDHPQSIDSESSLLAQSL